MAEIIEYEHGLKKVCLKVHICFRDVALYQCDCLIGMATFE